MNLKQLNFARRVRAAACVCAALVLGTAGAARAQGGRVIVLGFDGADGHTVEQMMERGELPHLARLREQGTFAPLGTTNPAESPVAWASLNAGQNPAKTAIPGFVMRKFDETTGVPGPIKGFAEDAVPVPLAELRGAPIPTWSPALFAAALGVVTLLGFALIFGALLRLKPAPTLVLSLALGAVGAWGGWTLRRYLPDTLPVVKNPLQAAPFWEVAGHAGVAARVYDGQQAWDREPAPNVKVLCGLGVPDARGAYTSYFVYTTDDYYFHYDVTDSLAGTGSGGYKLRVDERDGVIETFVYGPSNFWAQPALQREFDALVTQLDDEPNMPFKKGMELTERRDALKKELKQPTRVPLRVVLKDDAAEVTLGGETVTLKDGAWSNWFHVVFELNPLLKVHAVTRAKVVSLRDPYFEMYVDTIQIDPAKPPFWQPISQPAEFAPELATSCGTFETIGWACLTHPFKDDVIDAVTFLQDIEYTTSWREKLVYDGLAKDDWKLLVGVFSEADRVQHMMYQFYDPQHPLYDATKAARKTTFYGQEITLAEAIPAMYRRVDAIVGKVIDEYLKPGDTLLLCADHGFQSFRRQVHINNWLAAEGYLVMKAGATGGAMLAQYVDWSKTRAYALGLGSVYINTTGGLSKVGCVEPAQKDALCREIAAKFLAATDPESGAKFGSSADLVSEIHHGPYSHLESDLLLGFTNNYRVSWATTSGGLAVLDGQPAPVCVDNDRNWSGDHVSVDPHIVKGMFFSNRKCDVPPGGVDLLHIAPTVLAQLGVALPTELDVAPLALK